MLDISAVLDALGALAMDHPLRGRANARRAVLSGHSAGCHTVWAALGATHDLERVRARLAQGPPLTLAAATQLAAWLRRRLR